MVPSAAQAAPIVPLRPLVFTPKTQQSNPLVGWMLTLVRRGCFLRPLKKALIYEGFFLKLSIGLLFRRFRHILHTGKGWCLTEIFTP